MSEFDHVQFLKTLSSEPGVYRMLDNDNQVIYVGKAKSLKKRVSSYFRSNITDSKTRVLVSNICNIEVTLTNTETEALLLENNLIKKYQPRYNILLRDDKSYPYILLTNHKHPRLAFHRGSRKVKGEYFDKELKKLKDSFPNIIEEVRGINFIKGLKLKVDISDFMSKLMKNKLLVVKAAENCIRLFPSLLSTTDELDIGIKIIKKTCEEMS